MIAYINNNADNNSLFAHSFFVQLSLFLSLRADISESKFMLNVIEFHRIDFDDAKT